MNAEREPNKIFTWWLIVIILIIIVFLIVSEIHSTDDRFNLNE
jgi:t-SNARE complex subunit (syntaxin)